MQMSRFRKFSMALIFYTLLVILWGAWVRISHSGDGCGDTWPLCQGQLIPQSQQGKTWVELGHRMSSGLYGILIFALWIWARKLYNKTHPARKFALLTLIFTITEALLGAKLVLFQLVGANASPYRAFIMSLHLLNSLALMAMVTLTWDFSKFKLVPQSTPFPLQKLKISARKLMLGLLALFSALAVSGAIAALASTLFPAESLLAGLLADLDPNSHFLIRLRGWHPALGVLIGALVAATSYACSLSVSQYEFQRRSRSVAVASLLAIAIGFVTLFMLSPVAMKILHLTMTHALWVLIILWIRTFYYMASEDETNPITS